MLDYEYDIKTLIYYDNLNKWCFDKSNEFKEAFSSLINNQMYVHEIALALANDVWDGEHSSFLEANQLNEVHALCYLHFYTNSHMKDVKEAYEEYISNQMFYD